MDDHENFEIIVKNLQEKINQMFLTKKLPEKKINEVLTIMKDFDKKIEKASSYKEKIEIAVKMHKYFDKTYGIQEALTEFQKEYFKKLHN